MLYLSNALENYFQIGGSNEGFFGGAWDKVKQFFNFILGLFKSLFRGIINLHKRHQKLSLILAAHKNNTLYYNYKLSSDAGLNMLTTMLDTMFKASLTIGEAINDNKSDELTKATGALDTVVRNFLTEVKQQTGVSLQSRVDNPNVSRDTFKDMVGEFKKGLVSAGGLEVKLVKTIFNNVEKLCRLEHNKLSRIMAKFTQMKNKYSEQAKSTDNKDENASNKSYNYSTVSKKFTTLNQIIVATISCCGFFIGGGAHTSDKERESGNNLLREPTAAEMHDHYERF